MPALFLRPIPAAIEHTGARLPQGNKWLRWAMIEAAQEGAC